MANFDVSKAKFSSVLRKFETTDKGHADVFNDVINVLINNDVSFDNKSKIQTTTGSGSAYTVTIPSYEMIVGLLVAVKFHAASTTTNPTLNINSLGPKTILRRSKVINAGEIATNEATLLFYDGTNFQIFGEILATPTSNGLMSSVDKTKLDGVASNANNYVHPATHPASIIFQDANNRFVSDDEKSNWNAKAGATVASTSANGLMSSIDKTKLDGIATNANNYVHPATHPASIIEQDSNNRFVSDMDKSKLNGVFIIENNTGLGIGVLMNNTMTEGFGGQGNSAFGSGSMQYNTTGAWNSAFGSGSMFNNTTGKDNSAFGHRSLEANTTGSYNSAFGFWSMLRNTTGQSNSVFGYSSLTGNTTGSDNSAFGNVCMTGNTTGNYNSAFGYSALRLGEIGSYNSAFGYSALYDTKSYSNCSGFGYNSRVTGDNQVQLGNSDTTVYTYGSVQNRSDERDKADIKDIELGLQFINLLRPVDFKWDYREDYKEYMEVEIEDEEGNKTTKLETKELPRDGSKKRKRKHHGLIAQEVKKVMEELGVDFGGYQDHSVSGGQDVLSIGYMELIAPMIKAIQELSAKVKVLEEKANNRFSF